MRQKPRFGKPFLSALLASLLCLAAACGPPPPDETVGNFFNALAQKDLNKAKGMLTGQALKTHPAPGSQASQIVFAMGKAYQGLADLKIDGDKAAGVVKLNGQMIAEVLIKASQQVLNDIRDPKVKEQLLAQMKKGMDNIARSYSRVPVKLVKSEKGWLISDLR